jgi:hypothetical protein
MTKMKNRHQSRIPLNGSLVLLLLSSLFACSTEAESVGSEETGGNTSWLSVCANDAECDGVCERGVCSNECDGNGDCAVFGASAACFEDSSESLALSCSEDRGRAICLPTCSGNSGCAAFGAAFSCASGFCQPTNACTEPATDGGASNGSDAATGGGPESADEPSDPGPSASAEDESAEDEPAEDEPAEDEPAEDEPVEDEPVEDEPAEDEPAEDEPEPTSTEPEPTVSDAGSGGSPATDSGANSGDAGNGGASSVGDSGNTSCGDEVCGDDEFCCGPPECGSCALLTQGPQCPDTCPEGAGGMDGGASLLRIPDCPGSIERCDSERCNEGEPCVACPDGQVCVEIDITCGPQGGSTAQCVDDPCAGSELSCSCADSVCSAADPELGLSCGVYTQDSFLVGPDREPFMSCSGGGVCASPDTSIATPSGDVPISQLAAFDLVYSLGEDGIEAVPLLRVARTKVMDHTVLGITLDDGSHFEISGPHPTADGRRLDQLNVGDELDGRRIVVIDFVPYAHAFTYDILPASKSGSYVANGVWMGTTLPR